MTDVKQDASHKPDKQDSVIVLTDAESKLKTQMLKANNSTRRHYIQPLILKRARTARMYMHDALWSKAFHMQVLQKLGPGVLWQHYADVDSFVSESWHKDKHRQVEWFPLAHVLGCTDPPMYHVSAKLIQRIKTCDVRNGQYMLLITVHPPDITKTSKQPVPPIIQAFPRHRTPRDDMGGLPGFRRFVYKCAICNKTGDQLVTKTSSSSRDSGRDSASGTDTTSTTRDRSTSAITTTTTTTSAATATITDASSICCSIPEPLITCPFCQVTYYCSEQHLLQDKDRHAKTCCTMTTQAYIDEQFTKFAEWHKQRLAQDAFYETRDFVQLYGSDTVSRWLTAPSESSAQNSHWQTEAQHEDEKDSLPDFGLSEDDVAVDMKTLIHKMKQQEQALASKTKSGTAATTSTSSKTAPKTKTAPAKTTKPASPQTTKSASAQSTTKSSPSKTTPPAKTNSAPEAKSKSNAKQQTVTTSTTTSAKPSRDDGDDDKADEGKIELDSSGEQDTSEESDDDSDKMDTDTDMESESRQSKGKASKSRQSKGKTSKSRQSKGKTSKSSSQQQQQRRTSTREKKPLVNQTLD